MTIFTDMIDLANSRWHDNRRSTGAQTAAANEINGAIMHIIPQPIDKAIQINAIVYS